MSNHPSDSSVHHVDHSHSRLAKLIDELRGIASAVDSHGTFERHHDQEFERFAGRLKENLQGHVDYEETTLFPSLRERIDNEAEQLLDQAIDEHRELTTQIERIQKLGDAINVGDDAGSEHAREFIDAVDRLESLADRHDETEASVFRNLDET